MSSHAVSDAQDPWSGLARWLWVSREGTAGRWAGLLCHHKAQLQLEHLLPSSSTRLLGGLRSSPPGPLHGLPEWSQHGNWLPPELVIKEREREEERERTQDRNCSMLYNLLASRVDAMPSAIFCWSHSPSPVQGEGRPTKRVNTRRWGSLVAIVETGSQAHKKLRFR